MSNSNEIEISNNENPIFAWIMYVLPFTVIGIIPSIIMAYVLGEKNNTGWLNTHYMNFRRIFWGSLIWSITLIGLGFVLLIPSVGLSLVASQILLLVVNIYYLYHYIRGMIKLFNKEAC